MLITQQLTATAGQIESELEKLLSGALCTSVPERLLAAMRHATLAGGKRLRPFLVIESARLFGVPFERAIGPAMAVELMHGYSLAHDDLPAMDNDRLRRGQPTVWAQFDEWTAILAGDALQTLAFEVLTTKPLQADPVVAVQLVAGLAKASGAFGMVGGQALDLEAEKIAASGPLQSAQISALQSMKTGALIRFSCEAGALLAQATDSERSALVEYGNQLGYAFQIADDLLDAEGDADIVGKAVAKDADAGKATLVSLMGIDAARTELSSTVGKAQKALSSFGDRAATLIDTAEFVASRDR